jgi:xyloglucan-binding protein/IPT/TIG domain-containing protein
MSNKFQNILRYLAVPAILILGLHSCKKDSGSNGAPVIESVRLVDSTKRDSTFTSSLTGTQILIHGKNFNGLQAIFFNDVAASFNTTFVTNTDVIVVVPSTAPTKATNPNVSNKIRLITGSGEATFDFVLVPPAPTITSVSNEMAWPGDTITIKGSVFYDIQKVIFPGNVTGTNLQVIDTATIRVKVPAGITTPGPIQVVGQYGVGMNPNIIFNGVNQPGMLANFEDGDPQFGWAYWGGIKANSSVDYPGNRGNYIQLKPSGAINAKDGGWYADNRAVNVAEGQWVPQANLSDPIGNYVLKFEIFVKTPWKNGTILIRNENPWKYTVRYEPWLTAANGTFTTKGWTTVSIPLTDFRTKANDIDGTGSPAASLSELLGSGKREIGFMLINDSPSPIPAFDAAFDNVRIVKR